MLRTQTTIDHDMHTARDAGDRARTTRRVRARGADRAMRPSFVAFLEDFDLGRFRKDAAYRLRTDQTLLTFSEIEATIFCRIFLKLLGR